MRDATRFARQWAGLVALLRLQAEHAPGATLIEAGGMVGSVMPVAPASSLMNSALALDAGQPPTEIDTLKQAFEAGGARKWGLWVDGDDERAAAAATDAGMVLDSHPAPMVADLDELPFDHAPTGTPPDLQTVGRINDIAYGYTEPKMAPAIAALPPTVITYGDEHSVAVAYDVGDDTAVWFVATVPQAQRQGRAGKLLKRLMLDARDRGQLTASLQGSPAGKPLYERLGFRTVGTLHLYEQKLAP
jgi:ribosomal protein S18 acetylase RimI-like enzyme